MIDTFPSTLAAMRKKAMMSQSKLAENAGCDHSYVSRLEAGKRQPTREFLDRLCTAMRLSVTDSDQLRIAANFMPVSTGALYRFPEVARLDRALAIAHDETHVAEALAAVRAIIRGLRAPTGSTPP